MSFSEQLMLSGAAFGAGTGHLIDLGAGDFASSMIAINISSPLDILER
jgi:hypothetical protein